MPDIPSFIAGALAVLAGAAIPGGIQLWQYRLARKHAIIDAGEERIRQAGVNIIKAGTNAMHTLDEIIAISLLSRGKKAEEKDIKRFAPALRSSWDIINEGISVLKIELPDKQFFPDKLPTQLMAMIMIVERPEFNWPDEVMEAFKSNKDALNAFLNSFPTNLSLYLKRGK